MHSVQEMAVYLAFHAVAGCDEAIHFGSSFRYFVIIRLTVNSYRILHLKLMNVSDESN